MKSSARKVELVLTYDSFSTEQERQVAKPEKVQNVPLPKVYPFPNTHPFLAYEYIQHSRLLSFTMIGYDFREDG